MPDETTDVQEQRDVAEHDEETTTPDELGDKGISALKAEREARKTAEREKSDLAKRIAEFEKAQQEAEESKAKERGEWEKIAQQREAELEEMKAKVAERDLKDRKAAIAKANGIPEEAISRLHGATDEELEEDAKALAKLLKSREAPDTDAGERTPPGTKKPDKTKFADPAMWGLG